MSPFWNGFIIGFFSILALVAFVEFIWPKIKPNPLSWRTYFRCPCGEPYFAPYGTLDSACNKSDKCHVCGEKKESWRRVQGRWIGNMFEEKKI